MIVDIFCFDKLFIGIFLFIQITSVAFGGPNLDELYVTSARFEPWQEVDGTLFRVTGLNVKGVPADDAVL